MVLRTSRTPYHNLYMNSHEWLYKWHYYNKYYDTLGFALLTLTSFLLPFVLGHPQFLVGTVINLLLFEAALYLDFKKTLPIIIMPSLGALSRSILFGPYTVFLVYMIPFIWFGNLILVITTKTLHFKLKKNILFSGLTAALLKTLFLFLSALLLFNLNLVPKIFLTAFGINQFITATASLIILYPSVLLRRKHFVIKRK